MNVEDSKRYMREFRELKGKKYRGYWTEKFVIDNERKIVSMGYPHSLLQDPAQSGTWN